MRSTVVTEQDVQRDIRLILKDEARPRSLAVAYALWLLLFWAGAHRFYLGRPRSAVLMLACSAVTLGIGGLLWACVDAFLIPRMLAERNVRFIEPRWMRVQPLGDRVPDPRRADRGSVGVPPDLLPDVTADRRHVAPPSSPPFLRRPADGGPSWATVQLAGR